jgi:predicted helicase
LWQRDPARQGRDFDWEKAQNYLHVPILHKLFRSLADRRQLKKWKLAEVLDWTAAVLNRVNAGVFFDKFKDAEAVQYFYEPFLEAFDPELRKQLGVWYTPPEIVRYMVARVDAVLRDELGRPDGLADPSVYVLDPCCGTGTYVVEVLRTIAATLRDKGEEGCSVEKPPF